MFSTNPVTREESAFLDSVMPRNVAMTTKYLRPTNTLGGRISVTSDTGARLVIGYDHGSVDPHGDAARAMARALGADPATVRYLAFSRTGDDRRSGATYLATVSA